MPLPLPTSFLLHFTRPSSYTTISDLRSAFHHHQRTTIRSSSSSAPTAASACTITESSLSLSSSMTNTSSASPAHCPLFSRPQIERQAIETSVYKFKQAATNSEAGVVKVSIFSLAQRAGSI
uniref:Uncharacterized protein n=1 Tax=Opuntia streptacantha TaxID=393608 RepID=A0A7C9DN54_OPUST